MKRVCGKSTALVIIPLLFLVMLVLLLVGRTASPKNEVIGEWATDDPRVLDKGELTMKADGTFVLCGKASGCFTGKYEVSGRELVTTLELKMDGTYTLCNPLKGCISGKEKEWLAKYKPGKTTLTVYHSILFSFAYGVAEKGMLSQTTDCVTEQKSAGRCTWIELSRFWPDGVFFKKKS